MMNPTFFDPISLESWLQEDTPPSLRADLEEYLLSYASVFRLESQYNHFNTMIQGLLSSLERKSIEPIALHLQGEKSVRSLQQFLARSPLDEAGLLDCYQRQLSKQINSPGGMLSVDDSGFVKKGNHSIGVKRQYCGRLGKKENCQVGVFLAYASEKGYGLVEHELYIPEEWFQPSHEALRKKCYLPETTQFRTKNEIALSMMNRILETNLFDIQWIGCDAAYGNDHTLLDSLKLPEGVWYFAATNSQERIYLEYPQTTYPKTKRGFPQKHPEYSVKPIEVCRVAENDAIPWEEITLAEGSKGPITAERKLLRCYASRSGKHRRHIGPSEEIWLYIRRFANGETKYFVSNAPSDMPLEELDRAATLRWPIEQCFEECKSNLGMDHYETKLYHGWKRHMQFVMIAHLFTLKVRETLKKMHSTNYANGSKTNA